MPQIINTNILSMVTQNDLNVSQHQLQGAIEKLSSGKRINSAKDDAAGLAIVNRMSSQINGLTQAQRNSSDGTSIAQTTEGALDQINDNLQKIRTLVVQAKNGSNSSKDKQSIQNEIEQRIAEINRVSNQSEFNGIKVLNQNQTITIQVGADDGQTIDINLNKLDSTTLNLDNLTVDQLDPDSLSKVNGKIEVQIDDTTALSGLKLGKDQKENAQTLYKSKDGQYYVQGDKGNYYQATVDNVNGTISVTDAANPLKQPPQGLTKVTTIGQQVTPTGLASGDVLMQGSDDQGNPTYYIQHPPVDPTSDYTYSRANIDSTGAVTDGGAIATDTKNPLSLIDNAIEQIDNQRSELGAVQNRFQSVNQNAQSATQNLSASRSRIQDTDYAAEYSNYTRSQVIQQAGMSMLSKANQQPDLVLKLLQ